MVERGRQPETIYAFTPGEWHTVMGERGFVSIEQVLQAEQVERPLREAVTDVYRRLTSRQKQVLRLNFGLTDKGNRSQQQTADELGISRSTVRTHIARALEKLRHPVKRVRAPKPEKPQEATTQVQLEATAARNINWSKLEKAALPSTPDDDWDKTVDSFFKSQKL